MKAYTGYNVHKTPQTQPIPGKDMVRNSEGGYVFQLENWKRLERFLILGSEGGTYYVGEHKLTVENAETAVKCIKEDGVRVVNTIVQISDEGRAHKNDPALFVLAMCSSPLFADEKTRSVANTNLHKVARIGTHLFHFMEFRKGFANGGGSFGRGLRSALQKWYTERPDDKLATQIVKYKQRDGWSHRDVLRVAHAQPKTPVQQSIFRYAVKGEVSEGIPMIIQGHELAMNSGYTNAMDMVKIIGDYDLQREMIPTEWLSKPEVWEALLPNLGVTAVLRNLGNMSKTGLISPMSDATKSIVKTLTDVEVIYRARVHPLSLLVGMKVYSQGHGMRGSGEWEVDRQIVDALNEAFYVSFSFIEPTEKNFFLGVDVSGSMTWTINNLPITCAEGAAVMAMVTARTEQNWFIRGFSHQFVDLGISPSQRLDDIMTKTRNMNFGGTDCALPMIYATEHKLPIDVFVVYTDSETWAGRNHPVQALKEYRQKLGRPAKLVVVGMTSNGFTIADPDDAGMMDIVGFDTGTPAVISDFARE
jgi:60 kDa SS-A/Ro ribonucleoprotein